MRKFFNELTAWNVFKYTAITLLVIAVVLLFFYFFVISLMIVLVTGGLIIPAFLKEWD
jgi:uncharacterized membrane protein YukC